MKRIILSIIACLMLIIMCAGLATPALAAGMAPVAENFELNTYRDTSVSGMLSAYDPEGDVVSYKITTEPIKGEITVEQNGSFIYTPGLGKKGRDYFGYKAIDSEGNVSQEATVIIRIEKKKPVEYKDMNKRPGEYAAMVLSENGIFTGEYVNGCYYFSPDKKLTCGEFALMCNFLSGKIDPEMNQEEYITQKDAALMLNTALGLSDVNYINIRANEDEPVLQACMNLTSVGVLNGESNMDEIISRETAALMLVQALNIIKNR